LTLGTGSIILTGFAPDVVLDSVKFSIEAHHKGITRQLPADYNIDNTSMRVLKLIMGNTRLSNRWHGIT
jgi:UDP-N-acetylglucosamine 2-epimerase (non-hydrolysing)